MPLSSLVVPLLWGVQVAPFHFRMSHQKRRRGIEKIGYRERSGKTKLALPTIEHI
jgi:hypothetical protein